MSGRNLTRCVAALALAGIVAGCTSGSDDATPDTSADPAATAPVDSDTPSTETPPTEPPTTSTTPPATSPPASGGATQAPASTLIPSPEADLPTQAPGQGVPVTTTPGPLPEPAVRLIELGTYDRPVETAIDAGDGRIFVVQQGGTIVAADDESDAVVFDISEVSATTFSGAQGEQGLLGLAFHPDEDLAYVDFTNADGNTVVAEFAFDPTTYEFDPTSYREILTVEQPFPNHNGGELDFGPDGYLYIGLGDGGAADDPDRTALDLSSRLGKLLRIDPTATDDAPFTVPDDNPFVGTDGADPTIWARGLRNPWRFSFDSLTGDLWIADVGQGRLEEIDLAPATDGRDAGRGLNFGWSAFEANEALNTDQDPAGHVPPVVSYPHENGDCSVSGGVVARDSSHPALNGWYVYGDFCSGRLWALDTTSVSSGSDGPVGTPRIVELGTVPALAAVTVGPFGDIHAVSNTGQLYRLAQA
ncbi:PQQ-dependent sugar dehydrogenase [Ilumatobacter sp.]|uniref:PQQ-dependent sugar dehydrogenase n=1 Tax=Ilumatobacter sp. TaxID=1967498 RepID=UPI003C4C3DB7